MELSALRHDQLRNRGARSAGHARFVGEGVPSAHCGPDLVEDGLRGPCGEPCGARKSEELDLSGTSPFSRNRRRVLPARAFRKGDVIGRGETPFPRSTP